MVTEVRSDRWNFSTIYEPVYGEHPVSGNRNFGFEKNMDGSYTFYTRGVDRLTDAVGTSLQKFSDWTNGLTTSPFSEADALWTSLQNKINKFVIENNGSSSIGKQEIERPDWKKVKNILEGKEAINSLSKKCNP